MNFDLSEEQQVVRDLAAQIFERETTIERIKSAEASGDFDRALWSSLADAGLLGLCLPAADGGSSMGVVELLLIAEQQGRVVAPVPVVSTLVTAMIIARHGSPELRAELLGGVIDGSVVLAAALAEVGANDVSAPTTTATATGAGYHLRGYRPAVAYGQHAKRIVVPARVMETDGSEDIALFIVDPSAPGVTVEIAAATDRQPMVHLTLDTEISIAMRFGDANALADLHRCSLVGLCALHLGVAQGSLALTASHVNTRQQFGKPLASFQAVGQRAADGYITTEALRVTTMNAAWRLAEGLPADSDVLIAAYWASEGGQQVTLAGQHLHGGLGADTDYPVHRYFQWSSQLANSLGTGSSHLARLGRLLATEAATR